MIPAFDCFGNIFLIVVNSVFLFLSPLIAFLFCLFSKKKYKGENLNCEEKRNRKKTKQNNRYNFLDKQKLNKKIKWIFFKWIFSFFFETWLIFLKRKNQQQQWKTKEFEFHVCGCLVCVCVKNFSFVFIKNSYSFLFSQVFGHHHLLHIIITLDRVIFN